MEYVIVIDPQIVAGFELHPDHLPPGS